VHEIRHRRGLAFRKARGDANCHLVGLGALIKTLSGEKTHFQLDVIAMVQLPRPNMAIFLNFCEMNFCIL
jgi:hypothetical protein